MLNISTGIYL